MSAASGTEPSNPTPIMFQSIIITILDVIGTAIWVTCAVIARIAACLMK